MSAVSTEVVPFSQMQKMATAVVKSGLFGVKTEDQALSLMALCQAEGIHPMTAVRDYHIIQGRPALKAETMLARYMKAGGKVEWHELSDTKAEATFSHPDGGTVRLDWTMARAATAGLASRDTWKAYPRAMLRSRLISEGVRTVCPAIVQGVYTPEEVENLTPEMQTVSVSAAIESFDHPGLPQDQVDGLMRAIADAANVAELKNAYQEAHKIALDRRDERRIGSFALAYDARKAELTPGQQS